MFFCVIPVQRVVKITFVPKECSLARERWGGINVTKKIQLDSTGKNLGMGLVTCAFFSDDEESNGSADGLSTAVLDDSGERNLGI